MAGRVVERESGGRDERCHGVTKETHVEHQSPPRLAGVESAGRLCRTLAAPRPPHVATSTATGWPDVATIPRGGTCVRPPA
ncbi:unnamed protein product [Macrosiphum euphorbiae]|uniref:Uncharacterized protein n=1 Tax=Macrosiphum euphorbiae TaxID=13131 RepID=A0AAV0VZQ7_9HEMI|nr:unnamed protein product [Macrosiphum euphorbiae]